MSASLTTPIEAALRHLAKHEDTKVSAAAVKFRIPRVPLKDTETAIWAWLKAHNGGRRTFSVQLVDRVIAAEAAPASLPANTSARTAAIGERARIRQTPPQSAAVVKPPGLTSNVAKWLEAQGLTPASTAQTFLVEVSPAIAASWLLLNQGNRNPSKAKIRRFAAAIKAGRWVQNGETVKFSLTGRLLDGQSRLRAIVLAGVPAVLEVRAGLPDAAQQSMDIGEVRKGTHTLEMLGEKYPAILAPALKLIFLLERQQLGWRGTGKAGILENMEIAPLLEKHAGLKASVGWVMTEGLKLEALMSSSTAAFFHYVLGQSNRSARDVFFASLATGLGLKSTSPAYHLREVLLTMRAEGMHKAKPIELRGLVIKAWNAHRAGERLTTLSFKKGEDFPAIAGAKGGTNK